MAMSNAKKERLKALIGGNQNPNDPYKSLRDRQILKLETDYPYAKATNMLGWSFQALRRFVITYGEFNGVGFTNENDRSSWPRFRGYNHDAACHIISKGHIWETINDNKEWCGVQYVIKDMIWTRKRKSIDGYLLAPVAEEDVAQAMQEFNSQFKRNHKDDEENNEEEKNELEEEEKVVEEEEEEEKVVVEEEEDT